MEHYCQNAHIGGLLVDISVIMGVLCTEKKVPLLKRSIESILCQTYSDFELIICDDGSSKEAKELLDELSRQNIKIKIVRSGEKITLPQKLNFCLKYAQGRYIARMDDDDFSYPQRFEKQLKYMSSHEEIDFVGCNVNIVCDGQKLGEYLFPENPVLRDFRFTQPFIHPTLIFRREALSLVENYSEDKCCILCEDYDLLMRLYAKGRLGANLQEKLFDYTVSSSMSSERKLRYRWNECVTRFRRFREVKMLPGWLIYVIKPLVVWLTPKNLLVKLKKKRMRDKR